MPYSGFEGFAYVNQANGRNDYVRKHNPAVMFDSVATNAERLSRIKNLTQFQVELDANKLPQWMFITPNMVCMDFLFFSVYQIACLERMFSGLVR